MNLLKAHHVIRPQQIYPLKGIIISLSFSEDKSQSGNTSYPLYGINAAISAIADKKEDLKKHI